MSGVDELPITVHISSPTLRQAVAEALQACEYADIEAHPLSGQHDGRRGGKPGSRPPSGNRVAIHAVDDIVKKLEAVTKRANTLSRRLSETPEQRKQENAKAAAIMERLRKPAQGEVES